MFLVQTFLTNILWRYTLSLISHNEWGGRNAAAPPVLQQRATITNGELDVDLTHNRKSFKHRGINIIFPHGIL
jgi:hypothetical protein